MNNPINLRRSMTLAGLPLVGLIPIILTVVVMIFMYNPNDDPAAWQVPVFAMTLMGIGIMVIIGAGIGLGVLSETLRIRAVTGSPWARWYPYTDLDDWHAAVNKTYEKEKENAKFSIAPVIVLGVILAFILGMLNFVILPQSAGVEPGLGARVTGVLVTLFVLGSAAVLGGGALKRMRIERERAARMNLALPQVVVGRQGVYDEAEGFSSFWGLRECTYDHSGSAAARIKFTVFHASYGQQRMTWTEVVSIRVPAEAREEVRALAERVNTEILHKKG